LATHGPTTLAEAFQDTRTIDLWHHDPWLVGFETVVPLRLLDLTGSWPTRAGASLALSTVRRDRARRGSQAIFDTYLDATGLAYPSSMDANRPCLALYERGQAGIPARPRFHAALVTPNSRWWCIALRRASTIELSALHGARDRRGTPTEPQPI
jgi:hypothetical protein